MAVILKKPRIMKHLYLLFLIAFCSSFTFIFGKKSNIPASIDLEKDMIYIPALSMNYREADPYKVGDEFVKRSVENLPSFYISPYEVSNFQYLEFVNDIKKNESDSMYKMVLPDTLVWKTKLSYNEPYSEYYFRHPAYGAYPVVGVNHHQCEMYCEWLTKKYNSKEKRKYKKAKFRLPSKKEWYAATQVDLRDKKGKIKNISLENQYKIYPWEGPWIRNSRGDMLANFIRMSESTMVRKEDTIIDKDGEIKVKRTYYAALNLEQGITFFENDYFDVTTPVKSYWPNEAGVYCLAGNVEEFVAEYGFTKGGSWRDPGYYLRNEVVEIYNSTNETSAERGFRFVMDVVEE